MAGVDWRDWFNDNPEPEHFPGGLHPETKAELAGNDWWTREDAS